MLLPLALLLSSSTGCRWTKHSGPEFKRSSRQHPFQVRPATHRAGELELTVVSGSISEVYTVVGSESFTARIHVRLANRGSRPLAVELGAMGAIVPEIASPIAVYFNTVNVPPNGQAELDISVPAGLTRVRPPLALVYEGVRMDL